MFSYYGAKKKIAKYYPSPKYDTIIEPFAGSAQYSLYGDNWQKQVFLYDKYNVIVNVWHYLINIASEKDIMALPDMNSGDSLDNHKMLSQVEKQLIGFCINSASAVPKKTVAKFNGWNRYKKYIADNLFKIKHWRVNNQSYENIPNCEVTWFIDPPYNNKAGTYYHSSANCSHIDYELLANWCNERHGQLIVCENIGASWLPFKPLIDLKGQKHNRVEAIYTRGN